MNTSHIVIVSIVLLLMVITAVLMYCSILKQLTDMQDSMLRKPSGDPLVTDYSTLEGVGKKHVKCPNTQW